LPIANFRFVETDGDSNWQSAVGNRQYL